MSKSTSTKRKAQSTDSSSTLHKFFTKPKATAKVAAKSTVARSGPKVKHNVTVSEIIIISDDEDDNSCKNDFSHNTKRPRITVAKEGKAKVESEIEFGIPDLLLCSTPPRAASHAPFKEENADFGEAELLHAGPSRSCEALAGITLEEDEWGMGDDEQVDDNDSDIEIIDDQPSTSKMPTTISSTPPKPATTNAFSTLMSSYAHNAAWAEAAAADAKGKFKPKLKGQETVKRGRRNAPFYKVLQGMPIAVDAFRYGAIPGVTAYFLTHAHSDHYTNLSSNWSNGPIYCSVSTANLIKHMLGVAPEWVHGLPMDVPTVIPETGGVTVTLIDANHCPGSCLFLFEGPQTVNAGDSQFKSPFLPSSLGPHVVSKATARIFRYLHCGDFRASPRHVSHPAVKGKKLDTVYLDTTYLDPKYTFPPQSLVISACADLASRLAKNPNGAVGAGGKDGKERTMHGWVQTTKGKEKDKEKDTSAEADSVLFVVGTYSIGKERIVKAIAQSLNTTIYCDARKAAILRCQNDPVLESLLTKDPRAAMVHLVPLGVCSTDRLGDYVKRMGSHWKRVVGFRPTGWTYTPDAGASRTPNLPALISAHQRANYTASSLTPTRNSTTALTLYGVPYSEHSSFVELACFALSCDWGRMIATVNVGTENGRNKIATWVKNWQVEIGRRRERGEGPVDGRTLDYW